VLDRSDMNHFTADDAGFYTTESLGDTQEMTPEGFLLCKNVPIARTGSQLYAAGEIPVEPDGNGLIRIERAENEVFRPETIASFNGKPVVDEHPPSGKVTPDSFRVHSAGVVINPRRGDGLKHDNQFLFADLLIQDQNAIQAVRMGKREVSAGYDAEYQQISPGQGRQRNIVGNHVALVNKGRCGPLCAIGDSDIMANRVQLFRNRIAKAVRTRDEAGVLNAVAELSKDPDLLGEVISGDEDPMMAGPDGPGHHHVTINVHGSGKGATEDQPEPMGGGAAASAPMPPGGGGDPSGAVSLEDIAAQIQALAARQDQMEQVLAMLADDGEGGGEEEEMMEPEDTGHEEPDGDEGDRFVEGDSAPTGDSARRATVGDSTSMREAFQRMMSQAEILAPGIQLPTFDAAAPARTTFDGMCEFRRRTLDAAKTTQQGDAAINTVMEGRAPKTFMDRSMTCDAVAMVYNAAAGVLGSQRAGVAPRAPTFGPNGARNGFTSNSPSPAELNKRNRERYGQSV
jgi:uncharacterized protein